jgi:Putative Actinobacterial Holin-X, holin superfamily III
MEPGAATRQHQRNAHTVEGSGTATEWSTLLGRMLDDLSRIIRLELQLLEARLAPSLTGMADRVIAALVIIFAGIIGGSCLLAALILLLHEWLKWWQSFAIGGVVAIACGFVAYSVIKRPPVATETLTV